MSDGMNDCFRETAEKPSETCKKCRHKPKQVGDQLLFQSVCDLCCHRKRADYYSPAELEILSAEQIYKNLTGISGCGISLTIINYGVLCDQNGQNREWQRKEQTGLRKTATKVRDEISSCTGDAIEVSYNAWRDLDKALENLQPPYKAKGDVS